jgi:negative regulator of flagellin synthesis FlgM
MKIHDNGRVNSLQAYQKTNASVKAGKQTGKSGGRDEVSISSEALEMARGGHLTMTDEQRVAREHRIAELKQSVQSGTYEIDAKKVADKIARYLVGE